MALRPPRVNQSRPYNIDGRRQRATETRQRVIETARVRFLRDGYAATTIAKVARGARVSPETIYKTFGGKAGLVRAICQAALAGDGSVHAERRSDELSAGSAGARDVIRGWGRLIGEVAPRIAPLYLLLRDAAVTEADAEALRAELEEARFRRMRRNATALARTGHLRRGLSVARTAEILWLHSAPEVYELLVVRRTWTPRQLGAFVAASLTALLLDESVAPARQRPGKRRLKA